MKKYLIFLAAGAALAASSCDDDFARPPVVLPEVVNVTSNTTLPEFKADYWGTLNAPATVGLNANQDTIIFKGRVCSSDETGNIYKSIIVQGTDENGEQVAIAFSVNANDLYETLPFGQEVAVKATGLCIGPYRNLLQFGAISGDQMTFMDESIFTAHVFRTGSGLPNPALVDTTVATIPQIIEAKSTPEGLRKWQSRLVRIDGVSFEEAGQPFAGTQTTNRYIKDAEGNRLVVRNSSYASFSGEALPYGTGSVVAILSYYSQDWQLLLLDKEGCMDFDGTETPDQPSTEVQPAGEGTAESPYNVTKALQVIKAGPAETAVYITGKITKIDEVDTGSFGNATYEIADEGSSETLKVFRGYWFDGAKFTSADQLEVGAIVVVNGVLVNYMGNTPEVSQGNKIVSYNGQTGGGGDQPQPGTEQTIYSSLSEKETALPEGWTLENVVLPEGATAIWSWKTYQDKGYLNASAYIGGQAKASEAYAVSPVIDLTGVTGAALTFDHAAKFQTTLRKLCGVVVREEGSTSWTELTVPAWPEAGSWAFANSGTIDLSDMDGLKVQIAFKYASDATGADTWEIKNLTVTGKK